MGGAHRASFLGRACNLAKREESCIRAPARQWEDVFINMAESPRKAVAAQSREKDAVFSALFCLLFGPFRPSLAPRR
jgi:hypothetical protein